MSSSESSSDGNPELSDSEVIVDNDSADDSSCIGEINVVGIGGQEKPMFNEEKADLSSESSIDGNSQLIDSEGIDDSDSADDSSGIGEINVAGIGGREKPMFNEEKADLSHYHEWNAKNHMFVVHMIHKLKVPNANKKIKFRYNCIDFEHLGLEWISGAIPSVIAYNKSKMNDRIETDCSKNNKYTLRDVRVSSNEQNVRDGIVEGDSVVRQYLECPFVTNNMTLKVALVEVFDAFYYALSHPHYDTRCIDGFFQGNCMATLRAKTTSGSGAIEWQNGNPDQEGTKNKNKLKVGLNLFRRVAKLYSCTVYNHDDFIVKCDKLLQLIEKRDVENNAYSGLKETRRIARLYEKNKFNNLIDCRSVGGRSSSMIDDDEESLYFVLWRMLETHEHDTPQSVRVWKEKLFVLDFSIQEASDEKINHILDLYQIAKRTKEHTSKIVVKKRKMPTEMTHASAKIKPPKKLKASGKEIKKTPHKETQEENKQIRAAKTETKNKVTNEANIQALTGNPALYTCTGIGGRSVPLSETIENEAESGDSAESGDDTDSAESEDNACSADEVAADEAAADLKYDIAKKKMDDEFENETNENDKRFGPDVRVWKSIFSERLDEMPIEKLLCCNGSVVRSILDWKKISKSVAGGVDLYKKNKIEVTYTWNRRALFRLRVEARRILEMSRVSMKYNELVSLLKDEKFTNEFLEDKDEIRQTLKLHNDRCKVRQKKKTQCDYGIERFVKNAYRVDYTKELNNINIREAIGGNWMCKIIPKPPIYGHNMSSECVGKSNPNVKYALRDGDGDMTGKLAARAYLDFKTIPATRNNINPWNLRDKLIEILKAILARTACGIKLAALFPDVKNSTYPFYTVYFKYAVDLFAAVTDPAYHESENSREDLVLHGVCVELQTILQREGITTQQHKTPALGKSKDTANGSHKDEKQLGVNDDGGSLKREPQPACTSPLQDMERDMIYTRRRVWEAQRVFVYEQIGIIGRAFGGLLASSAGSDASGGVQCIVNFSNGPVSKLFRKQKTAATDQLDVASIFMLEVTKENKLSMPVFHDTASNPNSVETLEYTSTSRMMPVKIYNRAETRAVDTAADVRCASVSVLQVQDLTAQIAWRPRIYESATVFMYQRVWKTLHEHFVVVEQRRFCVDPSAGEASNADMGAYTNRRLFLSHAYLVELPVVCEIVEHAPFTLCLHERTSTCSVYSTRAMATISGVRWDDPVFRRVASEFPALTQNEDMLLTLWCDGIPLLGSGTDRPHDSTATLRQSGLVVAGISFLELYYTFEPCRKSSGTVLHKIFTPQLKLCVPTRGGPPVDARSEQISRFSGSQNEMRGILSGIDSHEGGRLLPVMLAHTLSLDKCNDAALDALLACVSNTRDKTALSTPLYTFEHAAAAAVLRAACELEKDNRRDTSKISVFRNMTRGKTRTTLTAAWGVKSSFGVGQFLSALTTQPKLTSWLFFKKSPSGALVVPVQIESNTPGTTKLVEINHLYCKLKMSYLCHLDSQTGSTGSRTVFVDGDDTVKDMRALVRKEYGVPAASRETRMIVRLCDPSEHTRAKTDKIRYDAAVAANTEKCALQSNPTLAPVVVGPVDEPKRMYEVCEMVLCDYMSMLYVEAHCQARANPHKELLSNSVYVVSRIHTNAHDENKSMKYHTWASAGEEFEKCCACATPQDVNSMLGISDTVKLAYRYKRHKDQLDNDEPVDKKAKSKKSQGKKSAVEDNDELLGTKAKTKKDHIAWLTADEIETCASNPSYDTQFTLEIGGDFDVCAEISTAADAILDNTTVVNINRTLELKVRESATPVSVAWFRNHLKTGRLLYRRPVDGWVVEVRCNVGVVAHTSTKSTGQQAFLCDDVVDAMYNVARMVHTKTKGSAAVAPDEFPTFAVFRAMRLFSLVILPSLGEDDTATAYAAAYTRVADYVRRALKFDSVHAYVTHLLLLFAANASTVNNSMSYIGYCKKMQDVKAEKIKDRQHTNSTAGAVKMADDDNMAMLFRQWDLTEKRDHMHLVVVVWCRCNIAYGDKLQTNICESMAKPAPKPVPKPAPNPTRKSKSAPKSAPKTVYSDICVYLICQDPETNKFSIHPEFQCQGTPSHIKSRLDIVDTKRTYDIRDYHIYEKTPSSMSTSSAFSEGRVLNAYKRFAQLDFDRQDHNPAHTTHARAVCMAAWFSEIKDVLDPGVCDKLFVNVALSKLEKDELSVVTEYVPCAHEIYWRARGFSVVTDVCQWLACNTSQSALTLTSGVNRCGVDCCSVVALTEKTLQIRDLARSDGRGVYSGFVACLRIHAMRWDLGCEGVNMGVCLCSRSLRTYCTVLSGSGMDVKTVMQTVAKMFSVNIYLFEGGDAMSRDFRSETTGHTACPWYMVLCAKTDFSPARNILVRRHALGTKYSYIEARDETACSAAVQQHTKTITESFLLHVQVHYYNITNQQLDTPTVSQLKSVSKLEVSTPPPAHKTHKSFTDIKLEFVSSNSSKLDTHVLFLQIWQHAIACVYVSAEQGVCMMRGSNIYIYVEETKKEAKKEANGHTNGMWVKCGHKTNYASHNINPDFIFLNRAVAYNYELHCAGSSKTCLPRICVVLQKPVMQYTDGILNLNFGDAKTDPDHPDPAKPLSVSLETAYQNGNDALLFASENRSLNVPLVFFEHIFAQFGVGAHVFLTQDSHTRTMARVRGVGSCIMGTTAAKNTVCDCTTVETALGETKTTCMVSDNVHPVLSYLQLGGCDELCEDSRLSMYEMNELVTMELSQKTTAKLINIYLNLMCKNPEKTNAEVEMFTMYTNDKKSRKKIDSVLIVKVCRVYMVYDSTVFSKVPENSYVKLHKPGHAVTQMYNKMIQYANFKTIDAKHGAHRGLALLQKVVLCDEGFDLECTHETLLLTRNKVLTKIYACSHAWRVSFICEICCREVIDGIAARGPDGLKLEICFLCVYKKSRSPKTTLGVSH